MWSQVVGSARCAQATAPSFGSISPPNGFLFWQAPDEKRGTLLTPVVVQGVLFLPIARYIPALAPRSVRPEDGMVALNAATGAVYWSRFDLERGAQLRFVMAEKA